MKRFLKYLFIILVLATALPFVLQDQNGKPLMNRDFLSAPKVRLPDFSAAGMKARDVLQGVQGKLTVAQDQLAGESTGEIFKWRDAEGKWVFSDRPNPVGSSQKVVVTSNLSTLSTPQLQAEKKPAVVKAGRSKVSFDLLALTTVPLSEVPRLIEDSKTVKTALETRYQTLPK